MSRFSDFILKNTGYLSIRLLLKYVVLSTTVILFSYYLVGGYLTDLKLILSGPSPNNLNLWILSVWVFQQSLVAYFLIVLRYHLQKPNITLELVRCHSLKNWFVRQLWIGHIYVLTMITLKELVSALFLMNHLEMIFTLWWLDFLNSSLISMIIFLSMMIGWQEEIIFGVTVLLLLLSSTGVFLGNQWNFILGILSRSDVGVTSGLDIEYSSISQICWIILTISIGLLIIKKRGSIHGQ